MGDADRRRDGHKHRLAAFWLAQLSIPVRGRHRNVYGRDLIEPWRS
jgi:hypothetical protein